MVGAPYFVFCTTASNFDEMGRASVPAFLGFFGCLGFRISRPPLFFGIGSPRSGMDPLVLLVPAVNADLRIPTCGGRCSGGVGLALEWLGSSAGR